MSCNSQSDYSQSDCPQPDFSPQEWLTVFNHVLARMDRPIFDFDVSPEGKSGVSWTTNKPELVARFLVNGQFAGVIINDTLYTTYNAYLPAITVNNKLIPVKVFPSFFDIMLALNLCGGPGATRCYAQSIHAQHLRARESKSGERLCPATQQILNTKCTKGFSAPSADSLAKSSRASRRSANAQNAQNASLAGLDLSDYFEFQRYHELYLSQLVLESGSCFGGSIRVAYDNSKATVFEVETNPCTSNSPVVALLVNLFFIAPTDDVKERIASRDAKGFDDPDKQNHATVLILNRETGVAEYFEPNGPGVPWTSPVFDVIEALNWQEMIGWKPDTWLETSDFCLIGPQMLGELPMCANFVMLYVTLRLMCPSVSRADIVAHMISPNPTSLLDEADKSYVLTLMSHFSCYMWEKARQYEFERYYKFLQLFRTFKQDFPDLARRAEHLLSEGNFAQLEALWLENFQPSDGCWLRDNTRYCMLD